MTFTKWLLKNHTEELQKETYLRWLQRKHAGAWEGFFAPAAAGSWRTVKKLLALPFLVLGALAVVFVVVVFNLTEMIMDGWDER